MNLPVLVQLPRKVLGRLVAWGRRVPALLAVERLLYGRIEQRLSEPCPIPPPQGPERLLPIPPAPEVRRAVTGVSPQRMIDLDRPAGDDLMLLARLGLQPDCILANRGTDPVAEMGERDGGDGMSTGADATAFQHRALVASAMIAVCPWSGQPLRSDRSFIAEQNAPIFYRFEGAKVFFIAVGREGRGWIKLYLYIPSQHLALLLVEPYRWHGWDEIEQLRSHLIAEHRRVRRYLHAPDRPLVCALVDNSHFAHHLWNALTGIDRVVESGLLARIDRLIVAAEPFGEIEQIFPELSGLKIERQRFPSVIRTALAENRLLLRLGGNRISDGLVERLRRVARARTPSALHARIAALRARHWPIVWVTVRVGNRTWVQQAAGLVAIGGWLKRDYPDAALIIDGFTIPDGIPHLSPAAQANVIAGEAVVVAKVLDGVGARLPVTSLVGASMFEAILYAGIADCYLAHHGSIQHKIGWFGDCPGLVHGNRLVLTDLRLRDAALSARASAYQPEYLDPTLVRDVAGAEKIINNRWPDDLSNYEFDPADAYANLRRIIGAR